MGSQRRSLDVLRRSVGQGTEDHEVMVKTMTLAIMLMLPIDDHDDDDDDDDDGVD
jgi:hypothetical protein